MSSRSVSNQAQIGLAQAKQAPERILKINAVCNFCTMKSAAELNRLDFFFDGHHGAASGIYWGFIINLPFSAARMLEIM